MLKRGLEVLTACLVLIVLVGGIGFAQDVDVTPTPDVATEATPIPTPEATATPGVISTPEATATPEAAPVHEGEKIKVCHIPGGDRGKANTIEIGRDALDSHLVHGDYEGECEEEFEGDVDEELGGAGITPDSTFYFLDKWFDGFGNCIDNRKEKVAEIKEMINAGNVDAAKESLRKYEDCAKEVEREVSPEEKENVKRGSRAIRKTIREIEKDIPNEDRKEFSNIVDKEDKIEAAAEIAFKIKDLCEQLSKLDPNEYSRVCRVKGDAPKWQIELDDDLTEEQKNGARKFAEIMSQCFRTQGVNCRCSELEDINKPFADRCSVVAPLAVKCEKGEESACEAMDEATQGIEDTLPDYLLDIFSELEGDVEKDQFEFHMPRECREAGAKTPKECMKAMFEANAPEECQQALKEGKISFSNEREARESCERIMFEANAPEECIKAGLKDHKECGRFMFKQNAPEECIDAGLTGEGRDDPRKCEKLMKEQFGEGKGGPNRGRGPGPDCRKIENPEERLKCYDGALEDIRSEGEGGFGGREGKGHFPQPCEEAQALTPESCQKIMQEWGEKRRNYDEERMKRERESQFREGEREFKQPQCAPGQRWNCFEGQCRCEGEPSGEFRPPEGEFKEGEFRQPGEFQQPPTEESQPTIGGETAPSGETNTQSTETSGTSGTDSGTATSSSGETTSGTGGTDSGGTTVTGGVIWQDNRFYDYYYWG